MPSTQRGNVLHTCNELIVRKPLQGSDTTGAFVTAQSLPKVGMKMQHIPHCATHRQQQP
jgi:hypothetical protein